MTGFPNSSWPRRAGRAAAAALAVAVAAGDAVAADAPVAVAPLAPIAVDATGRTDIGGGVLGPDLWRDSDRAAVAERLERLPVPLSSPTLRALRERLLTAGAAPPAAAGEAPGAFLATRLAALMRGGAWETALGVLEPLPADARTSDIARVEVETRLLAGDREGACRAVDATVAQTVPTDPFWLRALTLCQVLQGAEAPAALSLSLLREAGHADPPFAALLEALTAGGPPPTLGAKAAGQPEPLMVAAALAAKARLPAGWAEDAAPWLARALVGDADYPAGPRLLAAERAHAAGALDAEAVRVLYRTAGEPETGESSAIAAARQRAAAFRAAEAEAGERMRADLVIAALDESRGGGRYPATADLYADVLAGLTPDLETIARAPDFIPALLVTGATESAVGWIVVAEAESEHNSAALAALVAATPYIVLLDPEAADRSLLALWTEGLEAGRTEPAAVLAAAITALGGRVPPALAEAAAGTPADPGPGSAASSGEIVTAGDSGSPGETLLALLEALPEAGPGGWEPAALQSAAETLRRLGLGDAARGVAIEAAAARGL